MRRPRGPSRSAARSGRHSEVAALHETVLGHMAVALHGAVPVLVSAALPEAAPGLEAGVPRKEVDEDAGAALPEAVPGHLAVALHGAALVL
eukprot:7288952-Alexandrium_andersonii.AAC.1